MKEDYFCTCCKELRGMEIVLVQSSLSKDLLECPECEEEFNKD